jgi:hypothetical protein
MIKEEKVYISGKITGLDLEFVDKKFNDSEEFLRSLGYVNIINPMKFSPIIEGKKWVEYLLDDIKVLFECDIIYLQNDWGISKGARVEYAVAQEIGLKFLFENDFNINK